MFVYVPYADYTQQHTCYPIHHPKMRDEFVLVAFEKKDSDGFPKFDYWVFHHESGSIVGRGETAVSAIEDGIRLIEEKGPEIMESYYQEHRDRAVAHENMNEERRQQLIAEARGAVSLRTGAVYLIKSAGRYKIGQSVNPEQRIGGMTLSEKPQIIVIHYTKKWKEAERELHLRFAHKRGHGEWFDFTTEELIEVEQAIRAC